jgi:hypothetical protein
MKVGIFLTCQHPPGSDMVAALEGQYAMTRLARDRGWDAVATGQHYLSEGVRQIQLVPFLARLAAEAGEMTGISGVLLTALHNPVEVAEHIASLDAIWRGKSSSAWVSATAMSSSTPLACRAVIACAVSSSAWKSSSGYGPRTMSALRTISAS